MLDKVAEGRGKRGGVRGRERPATGHAQEKIVALLK
jgi:hypothetical protein